jgi:glycine/D-amino acid oxidase-like deaminating enzyme
VPPLGGRPPLLPNRLPAIDRVPGHHKTFVTTGHGDAGDHARTGVRPALAEFMLTGRRPEVLAPFRADRF